MKRVRVILTSLLMGLLVITSVPMTPKASTLAESIVNEVTTGQIVIKVGKAWGVSTENIDKLLAAAGYDYKSTSPTIFYGERVNMDTEYLMPACGVGVHDANTLKLLDFLYIADNEWTDLLKQKENGTLAGKYKTAVFLAEEAEGLCYYARAEKAGRTTITIPEYQLANGETITVKIPVVVEGCVSSDILYNGTGEKAPTCTSEGIGHRECTVCGDVLESNIQVAKLKHNLAKVDKVAATTTKTGMEAHYHCSVCSKLFSDADGKNEVTKTSLTIPVVKVAKGSIIKDKNGNKYKVTKSSLKNGTISFVAPGKKNASTVKISNTVKINGITYKITAIEKNAFKSNKYIKKVTIGDNVNTIGENAFSGCTKLKTVELGKNVTTINGKAFYKCTSLTSITIPSKVKTIGVSTFHGCKKLKSLTIKTKLLKSSNIGKNAFRDIKKDATIRVPKSKFTAYKTMLYKNGVNKKAKFKKS